MKTQANLFLVVSLFCDKCCVLRGGEMMENLVRLAVIGDIHGNISGLKKVVDIAVARKSDGLLLVGDFITCGFPGLETPLDQQKKELESIFEIISDSGLPMVGVPGNHDSTHLDFRGNIDRRESFIAGLKVFGIGGSGRTPFKFPNEWDQEEVSELMIPQTDILLCHAPPYDSPLDRIYDGTHVGSSAIRSIAEKHTGVLVCGHIHESTGIAKVGKSLCMNVGSLGEVHSELQIGYVIKNEFKTRLVHENLDSGIITEMEL